MRKSELGVVILVEAEDCFRAFDEDRSPDQVGILHHQINGFLLGTRQRSFLENRASLADEIEKMVGVDMALEEFPGRRFAVDIELVNFNAGLLQKTSGVAAGRSTRFPVESRFRHRR
jgi:hypothetical protein